MKKFTRSAWVLVLLLPLAACGGGSSSGGGGNGGGGGGLTPPPPINQVAIAANFGVTNDYTNGLFTSVIVCVPGTTNCTTVDNVLVDSGSYGLRLLDTALASLPLKFNNAPDGNPLGECTAYVSAFNWGPVANADVKLGGEIAANVPVQVMGVSGFPAAPNACTSGGLTENDTQQSLGANGILGVGVFRYDCGGACSSDQGGDPNNIPPVYFTCPSSGCTTTLLPLAEEVQNPVSVFPQDNNGELITLPSISASGAMSANGTMTFGIGTETNNQLSGQAILGADGYGNFQTDFQGTTYYDFSQAIGSVIDSGSNANFFLDATTLNIMQCSGGNSGFYCLPAGTPPVSYTATNLSADGTTSATATWDVADAQTLFNTGNWAFDNLAGSNPGSFDFGLAFFFGKTVVIGLNGAQANSNGKSFVGPFYGY